jgi:hypothetical protein
MTIRTLVFAIQTKDKYTTANPNCNISPSGPTAQKYTKISAGFTSQLSCP